VFARIEAVCLIAEESMLRKILWENAQKLYKVSSPTAADETKRATDAA
jgi:hypothetical protein